MPNRIAQIHDFDTCLSEYSRRHGKLAAYEKLREAGVKLEEELREEGSLEDRPSPETGNVSWGLIAGTFLVVTVAYILLNY